MVAEDRCMLGMKYPDEFNLKSIETKIKEIGEKN